MAEQQNLEEKLKIDIIAPSIVSNEELGKDYDAELYIGSRGDYMISCVCGATSVGRISDITFEDPFLYCNNCRTGYKSGKFINTQSYKGPKLFAVKLPKSDKDKILNSPLRIV